MKGGWKGEGGRGREDRRTIVVGIMVAVAIGSRGAVVARAVVVALTVFVSLWIKK